MKQFITLLAVALTASLSVSAAGYDYLTVQQQDGSQQSFAAQDLTLTFSGSQMTATQGGTSTVFTLAALQKMFFSDTFSDITLLTLSDSRVEVSTVSGVSLGRFESLADAQSRLPKGLYLVRSNGQTLKIAVR